MTTQVRLRDLFWLTTLVACMSWCHVSRKNLLTDLSKCYYRYDNGRIILECEVTERLHKALKTHYYVPKWDERLTND